MATERFTSRLGPPYASGTSTAYPIIKLARLGRSLYNVPTKYRAGRLAHDLLRQLDCSKF
jgi:hypothetical protein